VSIFGVVMSKLKVALLVDEYFGGTGTVYGGYGFLARHLIAKHLPNENIEVEVLIKKDCSKQRLIPRRYMIDGIKVYRLAAKFMDFLNIRFLKKKNYDLFLSIEMTTHSYRILKTIPNIDKKLLFWVQDPRPDYEWDEINTVKLFPEKSYWDSNIYQFVHDLWAAGKVSFISQARFLDRKARDLYNLDDKTEIKYLPNPIEIDHSFDVATHPKKNRIIFLGRIESVKRGWLFCEIAKLMPEYEFFMLGQSFRQSKKNQSIMNNYLDIPNLHFVGHVEGEKKAQLIKDAKILVNTSIHEALPISFLEALSYGTLLVSCRDPDELTSQFGVFTGTVLGDGFDKVPLFVDGIRHLMENEPLRQELALKAVNYIKATHSIEDFQKNMQEIIFKLVEETKAQS